MITCACLTIFILRRVAWRLFVLNDKLTFPIFLSLSWEGEQVTKRLDAWAISGNGRTLLCPSLSWQHAKRKKAKWKRYINKGSQFPMRDCQPCPFLLINVYHIFHRRTHERKVAECAHTHTRTWVSTSAVAESGAKKTKERESLEIFIIIISCGFCADDIFHHHIGFFLLLSHVFFIHFPL